MKAGYRTREEWARIDERRRRAREAREALRQTLDIEVETMEWSTRTSGALARAGIRTVGQLVQRTEEELLAGRNFGRVSLREVIERLGELGLELGMTLDPAQFRRRPLRFSDVPTLRSLALVLDLDPWILAAESRAKGFRFGLNDALPELVVEWLCGRRGYGVEWRPAGKETRAGQVAQRT